MSYLPTRPIARRLAAVAAAATAVTAAYTATSAYAASSPSAAHAAVTTHAAVTKHTAVTSPCGGSSLRTWIDASQRSESAGITYYPLEFTNIGGSTCTLSGYPAVSVISKRGDQLGSPAGHGLLLVAPLVRLAPGATAHTTLAYHSGLVSAGGRCGSVDKAYELRIYADGLHRPEYASFGYRVCSHAGPVYLTVTQPIRAGIG